MDDLIEEARHYGERNAKATAALNHLFTLVIDAAVATLMAILAGEVEGSAVFPLLVGLSVVFAVSALVRLIAVVVILTKVARVARRRKRR